MTPPVFHRYLGIHLAGAVTLDSGLKSLRVYSTTPETPLQQVLPPPGWMGKGSQRRFGGGAEISPVNLRK
jgi:hypothetical protein